MKHINPLYLFAIAFSLVASASFAEPSNIYYKHQELLNYVDSGAYLSELTESANKAKAILQKSISENKTKKEKLAVVLDIDETVLSNYASIKEAHFGGTQQFIDEHIKMANGRALSPMKDLYQFAQKNKVSVFFVTGRDFDKKSATLKNLKEEGFKNYKKVYFKPKKYNKDRSVIPYKTATRTLIEQQGYHIVLSVGDQQSDIKGGHADYGIKLPNPFYYLP